MALQTLSAKRTAGSAAVVGSSGKAQTPRVLVAPAFLRGVDASQAPRWAAAQQQQQLRQCACASSSNDVTETLDQSILEAARDPAISLLAQQVLEAEAELQGMFEPGKPMPAASMVAKKRQQIADMKLLLAAKLNGQQTPVDPDASDDEAERARQLFLEVERSLQRKQRPRLQRDAEYSFELALLEAENERLREKAEALLKRQAVLEEIAQKAGLLILRDGQLFWTKGQQTGAAAARSPSPPSAARPQQQASVAMAVQDRLELAAMSVASR